MTGEADRAPAGAGQAGVLADTIVRTVTRCPDVAGLTTIPGIPVATYLPGRTVSGVAVREGEVEVCVVARFGVPLPKVAAEIREALAPLVPGWEVDVVIADITSPQARPEARPEAAMASAGRHQAE